ncbi:hypothetical protein ACH4TX_20140 [Streptomyces sp. NPDC021098]|uniref:hypothetical protein n=1 Tax=unclassified Streptomyces TaxID=2593676 RepID=UPI0037B3AA72
MHMEQGSDQEYVVKTDPGVVARVRASLLRSLPVQAWAGVGASVFVVASLLTIHLVLLSHGLSFTWPLLSLWLVPLWLYDSKRRFAALKRLKQTWATKEISTVAMRVTPEGLTCVIDAAPEPVVLPWAAVTHVQVKGRERLTVLRVALAPGAATAPGATGLDQPEARSRTRRSWKGVSRLHLPVFARRQSVSEIDQAVGHFSGGRVRVG